MKMHHTLIEKLISTFQVYAGWRDEKKLREALQKLNISVYKQTTGNEVLVDSAELEKQTRNITQGIEV